MWLELFQSLRAVVDEGESGALASTVLRAEVKARNLVFFAFVKR